MIETILHLIEGGALLLLSAWAAKLQSRGAKVIELELRLVKVETQAEAHDKGLDKLQGAVEDIRDHMARREDLDALRADLKS